MKKVTIKQVLILLICVLCMQNYLFAQLTSAEKLAKNKARPEAQKLSRQYIKQGWKVADDINDFRDYLQTALAKTHLLKNGKPRYFIVEAISAGDPLELAKQKLAKQIQKKLTPGIISKATDNNIDTEKLAEVVNSASLIDVIAAGLGNVTTDFEMFHEIRGTKKIKKSIRVSISTIEGIEIGRKIIKQEIKEKMNLSDDDLKNLGF